MKAIVYISRILLGSVFVFSGFVKGVDPLGLQYKLNDYFTAFGIEWMQAVSLFLSFVLSLSEFLIGISLLFNLFTKITAWVSTLFMAFFTCLTFILAIYNPVTDCGCFGDAIILTNWQTFYKNLIFCIPTLLIFVFRNQYLSTLKIRAQFLLALGYSMGFFVVSYYCYVHLPIFDFRPYKVGTYIPDGMKIPNDAPRDEYKSTFVYEKDGVKQEFDIKNLPDTTWTWIETKNELVKKGYEPLIHDFSIVSTDGEDITDIVLDYDDYYFVMVSYALEKFNSQHVDAIQKLSSMALSKGIPFIGLTSTGKEEMDEFIKFYNFNFPFYNADEITLKTIIRSNPGIMVLKKGVVAVKWAGSDIPDPELMLHSIDSYIFNDLRQSKYTWINLSLLGAFLLVASLFFSIKYFRIIKST